MRWLKIFALLLCSLPLAAQLQVVYNRSGLAVVADPTFSPTSPYSGAATSLTISDTTPGATILYCTDGTNTCTPSTVYSGAITVSSTEFVRAQGTLIGVPSSNVTSWSGTIAAGSATYNRGTTNTSSSNVVTASIQVTSGDLVYVISKTDGNGGNGQTLTVSTSSGPACTWNPLLGGAIQQGGVGGLFSFQPYYCIAPSSGTLGITATWSGTGSFSDIAVADYSPGTSFTGVDTSAHYDNSNNTLTNCATTTGTPPTTANANDLIIVNTEDWTSAQTYGALTGFTARASSTRNTVAFFDKYITSSGESLSYTVTLSTADICQGLAIAFKD